MYAARRTGVKREMFGYVPGGYSRVHRVFHQRLLEDGIQVEDARIAVNIIKDEEIKKQFIGLGKDKTLDIDIRKAFPSDIELTNLLRIQKEDVKNVEGLFQIDIKEVLKFENAEVNQELYDKIYGVQLKQGWNSSTYSDEGYLFLMIDFTNPKEPIIHVRAWQPEKFEDGSTITIFDFEIVEASDLR